MEQRCLVYADAFASSCKYVHPCPVCCVSRAAFLWKLPGQVLLASTLQDSAPRAAQTWNRGPGLSAPQAGVMPLGGGDFPREANPGSLDVRVESALTLGSRGEGRTFPLGLFPSQHLLSKFSISNYTAPTMGHLG